jgi:hypothetical protein
VPSRTESAWIGTSARARRLGYSGRQAAVDFRGVSPSGWLDHEKIWRHWFGADHLGAIGGVEGRPDLGGKRTWPRQHLSLHRAVPKIARARLDRPPAALATSYDDVAPLFDECWQFAPSPAAILAQAIPDRQDVLRQYLDYLLAKKYLDLAEPIASKVMGHAGRDDVAPLLSYCGGLLAKHRAPPALEIWNSLGKKRLLDYPALVPEMGASITNGDFRSRFSQRLSTGA